MANRTCPNCQKSTVRINSLLFADSACDSCNAVVTVHKFYGVVFGFATLATTAASSIVVLASQGMYAALLLLPLPIGAMSYLKARFCPLSATID